MIVSSIIQVSIPLVLQQFFDMAIASGIQAVLETALLFIILSAVNFGLGVLNSATHAYLSERIVRSVQVEFFRAIHQKSMKFHDNSRTGELLSLATSDSRNLSWMETSIRMLSIAVITTVSVVITMQLLDWRLLLIFLMFVPFIAISIFRHGKKLARVSVERQRLFARWQATLQENLIGIRALRTLSNRDREFKKYDNDLLAVKKVLIKRGIISARYFSSLYLYLAMGVSFILGGFLVVQGEITTGTLIAFNSLILLVRNVNELIRVSIFLGSMGFAGGRRVFDVLLEQQLLKDGRSPIPSRLSGKIEYNHVSFRYESLSTDILKDITLEINTGTTVAILGHTGCGKTTLIKLLQRLYDPTEGQVIVDGKVIKDYPIEQYRKQVGVIEQDTFIFSATIKENILYGLHGVEGNYIDEQVVQAAKLAHLHEFIMSLPKQYNTMVGERGITLSGGQRQRLAIARALIINPPILVMDDSTSAVDARTEAEIQRALKNLMADRTTLIITHRLSTIRKADKVILMENGRIKVTGTHKDLYSKVPEYAAIFKQFEHLPSIPQIVLEGGKHQDDVKGEVKD